MRNKVWRLYAQLVLCQPAAITSGLVVTQSQSAWGNQEVVQALQGHCRCDYGGMAHVATGSD
jgi:hypothetical protein